MAEITIKLTEKMVFDRQHCYEDSECSECSCCMANDECLFNFREERKVGKWICVHHLENKITYDSWKCSECQHDFNSEEESTVDFDEYKFCPNCGAEMRGNKNE